MPTFPKGHWTRQTHTRNEPLRRQLHNTSVQTTAGHVTWIVDPGDHLTLRGIPAIGRGVRGATRDSVPGEKLDNIRPV